MRVRCSNDNKLYSILLVAFLLLATAFAYRVFTYYQEPVRNFDFEPLSEEKIARAAQSYRAQERTIQAGMQGLNNINIVKALNSDVLPKRRFAGLSAAEMCETGKAKCVAPFAKIRPLIVVRFRVETV
ncbi:unnamed protein product [Cylicostephanus goldi]|uniref:Uncharacterized protein n=1 Tax=Cylicostephanus goldi TaxID=71465 RepID=A0A3P6TDT8_CYLGO|nr:unnamed protein product [Cylicostephanus goldi]